MDERTPLLERLNFSRIFTSNLDEFFMKRVGGLKRQVLAEVGASGPQAIAPSDQLAEIRKTVLPLLELQAANLRVIDPQLRQNGIFFLRWEELTESELDFLNQYFENYLFPVLTPLAVDPGHPFPFISNLSASYGVLMRNPNRQEEEFFARVKIPDNFPVWICVNDGTGGGDLRYASLYELVGRRMSALFTGMEIVDLMMFRVTRNADIEKDEEDAEDLLEMVAEELRERRFAPVVRLEHGPNPSRKIIKILQEQLEIVDNDTYELPLWLEFFAPPSIPGKIPLKYPAWTPIVPPAFSDQNANIFDLIRNGDVLVHHPYESFTASSERFIKMAAEDPHVIAVKMTLYRTGIESPFIPLLIRAAEAGKQVACLVELQARFDEERNIAVAQKLEKAGVHVVYGMVGLKTHCKIAMVIRQELEGVKCYAHIGTGNYHAQTSRLYTDLSLFTAKRAFTDDLIQLFHFLTGRSIQSKFQKLLVAPIDMKSSFLRMIEREAEQVALGRPAHIIAKMNSLEDTEIIEALYRASQAGVRIDLIVRGVCCLIPKRAGLSDNIRVLSVIGRFLEHSRIYYFRAGADTAPDGQFFIGSADWMSRNLHARVEAITPVEEGILKKRVWEILEVLLQDERQVWEMQEDGTYLQRNPGADSQFVGSHDMLMKLSLQERERTR